MLEKVIEVRRGGRGRGLGEFLIAFAEALKEGWEIPDNFEEAGTVRQPLDGWYYAKLVKGGTPIEIETVPQTENSEEVILSEQQKTMLAEIDLHTKSEDIRALARTWNVELPEEAKRPTQMQAYLRKFVKGELD